MRQTFFSDIALGVAAAAGAKYPRASTKTRVSTKPLFLQTEAKRQQPGFHHVGFSTPVERIQLSFKMTFTIHGG
jgi:hypothetical protein